jgi:hypothetical protein
LKHATRRYHAADIFPAASSTHTPTTMTVSTKPAVWFPTRIHPEAFKLAHELFDVITPPDPRAANWWEYAEGSVVRTGGISTAEADKAHKLRIIARNGASA